MMVDGLCVGNWTQVPNPEPAGQEQQQSGTTLEEQHSKTVESEMPNESEEIRKLAHERKNDVLNAYADEMIRIVNKISQEADSETFCKMKFRRKFFVFGQVVMTCTKKQIFCELDDGDVLHNLSKELADGFNKIPSKMYNSTNTYFSQEQEFVLKRVMEFCKKLKIEFHIDPNLLSTLSVYISWWKG